MTDTRPALDLDLYSDEALRDPYPLYRAIRERAPAVWLPAQGVWALGRYDDVRAALRADTELVSGRGIGLSALVNAWSACPKPAASGCSTGRRRRSTSSAR